MTMYSYKYSVERDTFQYIRTTAKNQIATNSVSLPDYQYIHCTVKGTAVQNNVIYQRFQLVISNEH